MAFYKFSFKNSPLGMHTTVVQARNETEAAFFLGVSLGAVNEPEDCIMVMDYLGVTDPDFVAIDQTTADELIDHHENGKTVILTCADCGNPETVFANDVRLSDSDKEFLKTDS